MDRGSLPRFPHSAFLNHLRPITSHRVIWVGPADQPHTYICTEYFFPRLFITVQNKNTFKIYYKRIIEYIAYIILSQMDQITKIHRQGSYISGRLFKSIHMWVYVPDFRPAALWGRSGSCSLSISQYRWSLWALRVWVFSSLLFCESCSGAIELDFSGGVVALYQRQV